jgi:hypothetical protein
VLAGVAVGILASALVGGMLPLIYAGLAAGAVADQLAVPPAPPGGPRVARPAETTVTDYVPGWLVAAVLAAAALNPLLVVLWTTAPRSGPDAGGHGLSGTTAAGMLLLTAAGLAASLLLARLVVRRRQSVGSEAALMVDDAFRAQAVRDTLHLTAAVSVTVAFVLSLGLMEPDVDGVLRVVGGWLPMALLLALAVAGFVHELAGGPRHWRHRLVPAR